LGREWSQHCGGRSGRPQQSPFLLGIDEDEEREGSFAVMAEAVGDDEEFEALNQRSNAYQ
jgi:hypothetical protein